MKLSLPGPAAARLSRRRLHLVYRDFATFKGLSPPPLPLRRRPGERQRRGPDIAAAPIFLCAAVTRKRPRRQRRRSRARLPHQARPRAPSSLPPGLRPERPRLPFVPLPLHPAAGFSCLRISRPRLRILPGGTLGSERLEQRLRYCCLNMEALGPSAPPRRVRCALLGSLARRRQGK